MRYAKPSSQRDIAQTRGRHRHERGDADEHDRLARQERHDLPTEAPSTRRTPISLVRRSAV